MTAFSPEQLQAIHQLAIQKISHEPLPLIRKIAEHYCDLRLAGENKARAEYQSFFDASKITGAPTIREKNMLARRGIDVGIEAWFSAYTQVISSPDSGIC